MKLLMTNNCCDFLLYSLQAEVDPNAKADHADADGRTEVTTKTEVQTKAKETAEVITVTGVPAQATDNSNTEGTTKAEFTLQGKISAKTHVTTNAAKLKVNIKSIWWSI